MDLSKVKHITFEHADRSLIEAVKNRNTHFSRALKSGVTITPIVSEDRVIGFRASNRDGSRRSAAKMHLSGATSVSSSNVTTTPASVRSGKSRAKTTTAPTVSRITSNYNKGGGALKIDLTSQNEITVEHDALLLRASAEELLTLEHRFENGVTLKPVVKPTVVGYKAFDPGARNGRRFTRRSRAAPTAMRSSAIKVPVNAERSSGHAHRLQFRHNGVYGVSEWIGLLECWWG